MRGTEDDMIDHAELEELAFDRAIDKLAEARAIQILDGMEKEAKRLPSVVRRKDGPGFFLRPGGEVGKRVAEKFYGRTAARRISEGMDPKIQKLKAKLQTKRVREGGHFLWTKDVDPCGIPR